MIVIVIIIPNFKDFDNPIIIAGTPPIYGPIYGIILVIAQNKQKLKD